MRRLALILLPLIAALTAPARGEEVVAALNQNRVALTANFAGSEILVFGAVRHEAPLPEDGPSLEVIVTIQGPSTPVEIWRKARTLGIWVNSESVRLRAAPSFYAVASTTPLAQALSNTEDLRHRISIPLAIRAAGEAVGRPDIVSFTEALVRIRDENDLYQQLDGSVTFERDTLFNTRISLPSNLTEGTYATRIFLTRGGEVIDRYETSIEVSKVGLERWLYTLAHEQPILYGLLALAIALVAGWGASAAFRYMRG